jgi:hypothetical protein
MQANAHGNGLIRGFALHDMAVIYMVVYNERPADDFREQYQRG